jgi:hypothetical protein
MIIQIGEFLFDVRDGRRREPAYLKIQHGHRGVIAHTEGFRNRAGGCLEVAQDARGHAHQLLRAFECDDVGAEDLAPGVQLAQLVVHGETVPALASECGDPTLAEATLVRAVRPPWYLAPLDSLLANAGGIPRPFVPRAPTPGAYIEVMRFIAADERDSTWERDDARYRVYRFEGPTNDAVTHDIVGATVEEALEAAVALSNGNEHLWALALVENDDRGMRGLIWLSGMDYNDPPESPREWQRRRQMQDRYLSERHRRGLPPVLPNGLRVIRVVPEWVSGWPLWESFTDEYHLTGPMLNLTPALSEALFAWNETWLAREVDDPLPEGWLELGTDLVRQLRIELDGIAEVRPDFLR